MTLPRWTWETLTIAGVGVLATLIAREMLRPPMLVQEPPGAVLATIAPAAPVPAAPPFWHDASVDPAALRRAYPTPFEVVPIEQQRNYRKLYLPETPKAGTTTY
jgi:hypothetical protein